MAFICQVEHRIMRLWLKMICSSHSLSKGEIFSADKAKNHDYGSNASQ